MQIGWHSGILRLSLNCGWRGLRYAGGLGCFFGCAAGFALAGGFFAGAAGHGSFEGGEGFEHEGDDFHAVFVRIFTLAKRGQGIEDRAQAFEVGHLEMDGVGVEELEVARVGGR